MNILILADLKASFMCERITMLAGFNGGKYILHNANNEELSSEILEQYKDFKILQCPKIGNLRLRYFVSCIYTLWLILRLNPRVIVVHWASRLWQNVVLGAFGRRVVVHTMGGDINEQEDCYGKKKFFTGLLLRRARLISGKTQIMLDILSRNFPKVERDKLRVLSFGVMKEFFEIANLPQDSSNLAQDSIKFPRDSIESDSIESKTITAKKEPFSEQKAQNLAQDSIKFPRDSIESNLIESSTNDLLARLCSFKRVYFSIRTFKPIHNHEKIIESFLKYFENSPHTALLCSTSQCDRAYFSELNSRFNFIKHKNLIFAQIPHTQMPQILSLCSCVISTKLCDGISQSLMEASAARRWIIANELQNHAELLAHKQNAFLLPTKCDERGIAREIDFSALKDGFIFIENALDSKHMPQMPKKIADFLDQEIQKQKYLKDLQSTFGAEFVDIKSQADSIESNFIESNSILSRGDCEREREREK